MKRREFIREWVLFPLRKWVGMFDAQAISSEQKGESKRQEKPEPRMTAANLGK